MIHRETAAAPLTALQQLPRHPEAVARGETSLSPRAFRSGVEPSFLSAAQVAQFSERGYCTVSSAFTLDEIAAVTADLDRFEASNERRLQEAATAAETTGNPADINVSGAITFTARAVATSEACRTFSRHPALQGIVRDIIGAQRRPHLYNDQCVYKKPAPTRLFPWHQDNGYAYIAPQMYLTCWVALTDATAASGCPWVVPYAHRLGTLCHRWNETMNGWEVDGLQEFLGTRADGLPQSSAAVCCEVSAGDVVVFSSLTPHMTGPNTLCGFVRKAYILQFIADGAEYISLPNGQKLSGSPGHPRWQYAVLDEHLTASHGDQDDESLAQHGQASADAIRKLARKGPKL